MRARLLLLLFLSTLARAALADPEHDAADLFRAGIERFDKKDYAGALEQFESSRARFATRPALENIASCLVRLGRFEEALADYEELHDDAHAAQLAHLTGFIEVKSVEGTRVLVDGRERKPDHGRLRAGVGTRRVRVEREGYAAREAVVTVTSGDTAVVDAQLAVVAEAGRLEIVEARGRAMDVRLDGAPVGRTPWSGPVSAGEHTVALEGAHDVGAPPRVVSVKTGATEHVTLEAGPLPASVRIEPSPTDAVVSVDGHRVSQGTWVGTLPSGPHTIDVESSWYESHHASFVASAAEPTEMRVVLHAIRRVRAELFGGPIVFPSYRAVGGACTSCIGYMVAGRVGLALSRHFTAEVFVAPNTNIVNHAGTYPSDLSLAFAGASAKLEFFERTPLTLRLFVGLARGVVDNTVYFTGAAGPEIQIGYRISETFVVNVGVAILAFGLPSLPAQFQAPDGSIQPAVGGGVGFAVPVTIGLRLDL